MSICLNNGKGMKGLCTNYGCVDDQRRAYSGETSEYVQSGDIFVPQLNVECGDCDIELTRSRISFEVPGPGGEGTQDQQAPFSCEPVPLRSIRRALDVGKPAADLRVQGVNGGAGAALLLDVRGAYASGLVGAGAAANARFVALKICVSTRDEVGFAPDQEVRVQTIYSNVSHNTITADGTGEKLMFDFGFTPRAGCCRAFCVWFIPLRTQSALNSQLTVVDNWSFSSLESGITFTSGAQSLTGSVQGVGNGGGINEEFLTAMTKGCG